MRTVGRLVYGRVVGEGSVDLSLVAVVPTVVDVGCVIKHKVHVCRGGATSD